MRVNQIVGIQEEDVSAKTALHGHISGCRHANIGQERNQLEPAIQRHKLPDDIFGVVGGAVFYHQALPVLKRLVSHALKRFSYVLSQVVAGDDDTYNSHYLK